MSSTTTTQQQVPAGTYTLDPIHSTVGFAVKHMVVSTFRGSFGEFGAALEVSPEGEVKLVGTVPVTSIEVKDENLKAHLLAPDFFDAERNGEIRFESTDVRIAEDGELVVDGQLTVKGNTRPVEARGSYRHVEADLGGGERVGIDLETIIDRTAFGLDWNAPLPKGGFALANEVKLAVELEFVLTR